MPISGSARFDAGAHDWEHRHGAATRTGPRTPPVQCCSPARPASWARWAWWAAAPAIILACLTCNRRAAVSDSLAQYSACCKTASRALRLLSDCAVASGPKRRQATSAPFWAAVVPHGSRSRWYYTPRMHAAYAGRAERHSLPPVGLPVRPGDSTSTSGSTSRGVSGLESWADMASSAIPDLPFLQRQAS